MFSTGSIDIKPVRFYEMHDTGDELRDQYARKFTRGSRYEMPTYTETDDAELFAALSFMSSHERDALMAFITG